MSATTPSPPVDHADVVVIGGGPAGSVTASLLAQYGHDVRVLERESFPRYHIGESLITGMLEVLDRIGVLGRIGDDRFPRKNGLSIVWGADRSLWSVDFAEIGGPYPYSYHVRRDEFDAILLDRARELGVTVTEEATVTAVAYDGDRVAGVDYTADGEKRRLLARMVIDASGQSRVLTRQLTEIDWQEDLRNLAYWSYFEGTGSLPEGQVGNILIERVSNGWFWAIPVDDRTARLSVGFVAPTTELAGAGGLQDLFDAGLAEAKELPQLLEGSTRVEEFRTTRDWSYKSDRFAGPGWLAAGDAGAFIDPLFSGGVCLAILGADPAAKAVDVMLRRPDLEAETSEAYHRGYDSMVSSFLSYVRFFYDPTRDREDYFAQAQAMADFHERYPEARQAFVAVISGAIALSALFDIPDIDAAGALVAPQPGA